VTTNTPPYEEALDRIRAEFLEMPDMRLRFEQIQRLCGVNRSVCQAALESLVKARFLYVTSDGWYRR
jgi:DNA-binding IclR family transcriptional regulator